MTWNGYKTAGWVGVAAVVAATGLLWWERKDPFIKARDAAEALGAPVERIRAWTYLLPGETLYETFATVHTDMMGTNRVGAYASRKLMYQSVPTGIRRVRQYFRNITGSLSSYNRNSAYVEAPTNAAANFHGYRIGGTAAESAREPCDLERIGQEAGKNAWGYGTNDWAGYAGWWETYVYTQAYAFAWETYDGTSYTSKSSWYSTNVLNAYAATMSRVQWAAWAVTWNNSDGGYELEWTNAPTCWYGYSEATDYGGDAEAAYDAAVAGLTISDGVDTSVAVTGALAVVGTWGSGFAGHLARPQSWTFVDVQEVDTTVVARVVAFAVRGRVKVAAYPAITNLAHRAQWYAVAQVPPVYSINPVSFHDFDAQGCDVYDAGRNVPGGTDISSRYISNRWSFAVQGEWTNSLAYWSPEWGPTNAPTEIAYYPGDDTEWPWRRVTGWFPWLAGIAVEWGFECCTNKATYWP